MFSTVFALFDERSGPYAAYFEEPDLNENIAKQIALQTVIITQRFHVELMEGESILSLSGLDMVSFFYFFHLNIPSSQQSEITPAVLCFVTETKNQMLVYQTGPELSKKARKIANSLKESLETHWITSHTINKEIVKNIIAGKFVNDLAEEKKGVNEVLVENGNTNYLLRNITVNLDSAVFGMIAGRPVVVTGERGEVELAIASLTAFTPHRQLSIVPWAEGFVEADLIGIDREKSLYYPGDIVLDIDSGKVFRGRKNAFCEKLLRDIKGKTHEIARILIKKRINWLLSLISAFSTVIKENNMDMVKKMIQDTDKDSLYLAVTILKRSSPIMADIIIAEMGEESLKSLV
ncbi:MAG: hypothetical protein ACFFD4_22205 [Candidatus Odinarchaeota archaeon]